MGTKTKNSTSTAKEVNNKLIKLDKFIRMHFDQINDTMLAGFMRFEAMIEVLLENEIVDKDKYSEKLKAIFEEMQKNVLPEVVNGASTNIDLTNATVQVEQEQEKAE
jgi:hypothetical protein